MLRIRLTRVGKKNSPAYRVVVAEQKKAVKRKFIEILGHYNPASNPKTIVIDKERSLAWVKKGAQPTDTVNNLMCDLGILPKNQKIKIIYGKKTKKKDAGKTEEAAPVKADEVKTDEPVATEAPAQEAATEESTEATPETETPKTETSDDAK